MLFNAITLASLVALAAAAPMSKGKEQPDPAVTGSGILLSNQGYVTQKYCFFENKANGNGWADPNFDDPCQCHELKSGAKMFVPLDKSFKGRLQRGTTGLDHTWVEFQLAASNDGKAHGDVSIEQGADGPCTIESTDGSGQKGGFSNYIIPGAPQAATKVRADGMRVLAGGEGSWEGPGNAAAVAYAKTVIKADETYIVGGSGVKDVCSANNAFKVTCY